SIRDSFGRTTAETGLMCQPRAARTIAFCAPRHFCKDFVSLPHAASMPRAHRETVRKLLYDVFTGSATFACWVTETAQARAILDVEDEVVAWARSNAHGNGVKTERVTGLPGNHVVRT